MDAPVQKCTCVGFLDFPGEFLQRVYLEASFSDPLREVVITVGLTVCDGLKYLGIFIDGRVRDVLVAAVVGDPGVTGLEQQP